MIKVGARVRLTENRTRSSGVLVGTVTEVEPRGYWLVVTPDDPALQAWFPTGYRLGSAHWESRLTVLDHDDYDVGRGNGENTR